MARRANDFYQTPRAATEALLRYWQPPGSNVFEACSGDGAIVEALVYYQHIGVVTNDIDPKRTADRHGPAEFITCGEVMAAGCASIITNPPFNQAFAIVSNFVGMGLPCAFLLRLSFLEPTFERGEWLAANPPSGIIVCPRISFTGDGKTDSVTCGWILWNTPAIGIRIVSKGSKKRRAA